MASRRSHAASHSRTPISAVVMQPTIVDHHSAPCPEGTRIHQKPTASSGGAQLWDKHHLILSWFRKAGPTIILNIIRDVSQSILHTFLLKKSQTSPILLQTATIVTLFKCQCCLTSFDVSIPIVRYTHSHRSIWICASNGVRSLKWRFRITKLLIQNSVQRII